MAADPPRRRPRRGSLERPLSTRIYRAAWLVVAVPVLVAAFSVGRPDPLPKPRLRPFFDPVTALQFDADLTRNFPDRSPGSQKAQEAAAWVEQQFRTYHFEVERQRFTAEVPGRGRETFVNIVAVAPHSSGEPIRSQQAIVVMAHRDNLGSSPGANDNASGTAALLELARDVGDASLAHRFVFLSTDAGAFGGLGADVFARDDRFADRIVAVVNLDAIAGRGEPRLVFSGDNSRVPSPTLLATADATIREYTGSLPQRPGAIAQLFDLGFPYGLGEQAPFLARGASAVTITTGSERPPAPDGDSLPRVDRERLGELGRSAQALLGSLDEAAEVARGTDSYVYLGSRLLHGWTIQFVLLAALLPFLAATIDLFARCRRRHIALWPALRSYLSRFGVWLWAGGVFAFLTVLGIFPSGADRPIPLDTPVANDWPVAGLAAFAGLSTLAWLVVRPNLAPARSIARQEDLGGHLAAMLVLAVVALVVAATNPYALLFLLPSLHAWLWLPQVSDRGRTAQVLVYLAGFAGPLFLAASFAFRYELGLDALWYILALTAVGYVPLPLVVAFLSWGAAAGQIGAVALGRYAPFPEASERPVRGPLREGIRQALLLRRRARGRKLRLVDEVGPDEQAETLER
jgi:peptidase M28-like protein